MLGRNGQALIAPSSQSLLGVAQKECVLGSKIEADPKEVEIERLHTSMVATVYYSTCFITDWKSVVQKKIVQVHTASKPWGRE